MTFAHDDPEFRELLTIISGREGIAAALIEKDYWVSHVLWSLAQQGLQLWFKGGTSLSKGFGLIHRFSEDLDLKIEPGAVADLPVVTSWKSTSKAAALQRQAHFAALARSLVIPSASTHLATDHDPTFRCAAIQVRYPGLLVRELGSTFRPFVLLEVGDARVLPCVRVDLSSFVHDHLDDANLASAFTDNRPRSVRCVHPLVTLIEKLDAIRRRFTNGADAPTFVRHYEDAAMVIMRLATLPGLEGHGSARSLVEEMVGQRQLTTALSAAEPAFQPDRSQRWNAIRDAHAAIAPLFWGPRIALPVACSAIRDWIAKSL